MKYLGVTIDARMSFKDYITNAGLKASKVARALAGIEHRRAEAAATVASFIDGRFRDSVWSNNLSLCSM